VVSAQSRGEEKIHFAVQDTGIGIPAERLTAIFESFTQADTSTTRTHGGTGLGLTIAKEIVARMAGELQVSSIPNEGTTFFFTVTLPVSEQNSCKRDLPSSTNGFTTPRVFNILLVEDIEENCILAKLRLERCGHKVRVVHDGYEALNAWEEGGMELILMDIHMPRMDGYVATKAIREQERVRGEGHHIPIIAMTAAAMKSDQEQCLEVGMDGYISKPIDFGSLFKTMEQTVPQGVGKLIEEAVLETTANGSDPFANRPSLNGIDVAAGLIKWGNAEIYRKSLIGFSHKHAEDATLVRSALARHDLHAAKSLAHAIKGVSGTLSARDLEAAASALDAALRQRKEEDGDMQALMDALEKRNINLDKLTLDFESALSQVIASCQSLELADMANSLDGENNKEELLLQPNPLNDTTLQLVRTIARSLSQGNITGVEKGILDLYDARSLRQNEMHKLLEQVDELELEQALITLKQIFSIDLDGHF
ncbi:MAG: response regulator, partial [Magnetococcales bacterium]|nr:response regulator [Magnetococcales bacterium]